MADTIRPGFYLTPSIHADRDRVHQAKDKVVNIQKSIKFFETSRNNAFAVDMLKIERDRLEQAEIEFDIALDDLISASQEVG